MVYSFLSSFIMIYLTNIVGLNAGIVGTLIAVSKLFDGVTDIFFGAMIDKTKSRLGKARPWMLYAYIGCAVTLIANFAIPTNMGKFAQYAWFFIAYTLLNAVFFTANNIAYMLLHKESSGICRILHLLKNLSAEAADLFYKCNTVLLSRVTQRLE